jgi:hypothetical protein
MVVVAISTTKVASGLVLDDIFTRAILGGDIQEFPRHS